MFTHEMTQHSLIFILYIAKKSYQFCYPTRPRVGLVGSSGGYTYYMYISRPKSVLKWEKTFSPIFRHFLLFLLFLVTFSLISRHFLSFLLFPDTLSLISRPKSVFGWEETFSPVSRHILLFLLFQDTFSLIFRPKSVQKWEKTFSPISGHFLSFFLFPDTFSLISRPKSVYKWEKFFFPFLDTFCCFSCFWTPFLLILDPKVSINGRKHVHPFLDMVQNCHKRGSQTSFQMFRVYKWEKTCSPISRHDPKPSLTRVPNKLLDVQIEVYFLAALANLPLPWTMKFEYIEFDFYSDNPNHSDHLDHSINL